jgi:superfamily II DNA or RNA helicase
MRATVPADKFEGAFSERVRERGERYLREGRVELEVDARARSGGRDVVSARVQGTWDYETRVERDGKTLHVGCTCPYFRKRRGLCKHLWATLLALQEAMPWAIQRAAGLAPLTVPVPTPTPTPAPAAVRQDRKAAPPARASARPPWMKLAAGTFGSAVRKAEPLQLPVELENSKSRRGARAPRPSRGREPDRSLPPLSYVVHLRRRRTRSVLYVQAMERRPLTREEDAVAYFDVSLEEPRTFARAHDDDRLMLLLLQMASRSTDARSGAGARQRGARGSPLRGRRVGPEHARAVLRALAGTGRCERRLRTDDLGLQQMEKVVWLGDEPFELRLRLEREGPDGPWRVLGAFCGLAAGERRRVPVTSGHVMVDRGVVMCGGEALPVAEVPGLAMWVDALASAEGVRIAGEEVDDFIATMLNAPGGPALDLPEELAWREERVPVTAQLWIRAPLVDKLLHLEAEVEVRFAYDELLPHPKDPRRRLVDAGSRRIVPRDLREEWGRLRRARELGFEPYADSHPGQEQARGLAGRWNIDGLPAAVHELLKEGWIVSAEEGPIARPKHLQVRVSSGIDWFDVHGDAHFEGGHRAGFEAVLDTIRSGARWVPLDGGGFGMLPETWLKRWRAIAEMGAKTEGGTRLTRAQITLAQAAVEDARAEDQDAEIDVDAGFEQARCHLLEVKGIEAEPPPKGFRGELRGYQRLALGWARFLEHGGFGGCLADDMGLGKTVQALAIIEARKERILRTDPAAAAPSLVVVPRSLIFNWLREISRFTPELRAVDHSTSSRRVSAEAFAGCDIVLTTYGVLRRDVDRLAEVTFDYCVLDEAQAIKNPYSKTAQASRMLRARHRLALSGTPIENHLIELWSLFEFLNPGMLGSQRSFSGWAHGGDGGGERRLMLAGIVRPFILRRTKREVAPELPQRDEQRLLCRLGPRQRQLYDSLRHVCRQEVERALEAPGAEQSGMQVLEALLRLRQAACHAALLDPTLHRVPSAKLDMLFSKLDQVRPSGHKALVFSQFVRLLALVRQQLDRRGIPYAYLDGQTRDREAQVARFQSDPDCPLFLISLKAGGLGLNLTAAEYVFLLDPWWNPAVEAQAVDRAHRIGQQRRVFAYRLVAEDTIEQKILELQTLKKELADAVIRSDRGFLSKLTVDDLRVLLR